MMMTYSVEVALLTLAVGTGVWFAIKVATD
jgi:hypothetical protein